MLIQRAVLLETVRTFFSALAATTGLAFFMLSIRFLERTPGIGMGFLLEIFPLFFPMALQFTVPLSMLGAVVWTFSRITADGELTALAATGVPLRTIARPVLAFAAVVALLALLLTDVASPYAEARLRAARRDLPHQLQTAFRSGLCDLDLDRARISFESYTGREFIDVCVEYQPTPEDFEMWRAQRGSIVVTEDDRVIIALKNVRRIVPIRKGELEVYPAAGELVVDRTLTDVMAEGTARRSRSAMEAWELAYVASRGTQYGRTKAPDAAEELARRTALAGSAFFYALIAIPLGVWSSRGGRVAAFLYVVGPVMLVYFPLVITGSNLARRGTVPALPALWVGNVVIGILGILLLRRVSRR